VPTLALIATAGGAYLAAMVVLVFGGGRLGSPLFFACVSVAVLAYAAVLFVAWNAPRGARRTFVLALLLAVAFRVPLALPQVNADNDMIRYLWDGRVQKLGINPYAVRPADPGLEFTHTDETRNMPSARHRTPYPPAAQLFFRTVVTVSDTSRAMKLAIVLCDLLTMVVVWRWLVATRRSEWLTLAYAWNPLVVLESAHSGHIDIVGALWTAAAVFWLSRRRTLLAVVAYVLAVATKLLPIVLLPLFWRRVTLRDAFVGLGLLVLLYLPYATGADVLFGIHNVVQHVRFNGPVFRFFAWLASPDVAARIALGVGLATAAWCRWKLPVDHPGAWAWPMALAIACAPVVYPWYLLYFTPFLLLPSALPLIVWGCAVLATYVVWERVSAGGQWIVPPALLAVEYALPLVTAAGLAWWWRGRRRPLRAPAASRSRE